MKIEEIRKQLHQHNIELAESGWIAVVSKMMMGHAQIVKKVDAFYRRSLSNKDFDLTLNEQYELGEILFTTPYQSREQAFVQALQKALWGEGAYSIFHAFQALKQNDLVNQQCVDVIYKHKNKVNTSLEKDGPYYLEKVADIMVFLRQNNFLEEGLKFLETAQEVLFDDNFLEQLKQHGILNKDTITFAFAINEVHPRVDSFSVFIKPLLQLHQEGMLNQDVLNMLEKINDPNVLSARVIKLIVMYQHIRILENANVIVTQDILYSLILAMDNQAYQKEIVAQLIRDRIRASLDNNKLVQEGKPTPVSQLFSDPSKVDTPENKTSTFVTELTA